MGERSVTMRCKEDDKLLTVEELIAFSENYPNDEGYTVCVPVPDWYSLYMDWQDRCADVNEEVYYDPNRQQPNFNILNLTIVCEEAIPALLN